MIHNFQENLSLQQRICCWRRNGEVGSLPIGYCGGGGGYSGGGGDVGDGGGVDDGGGGGGGGNGLSSRHARSSPILLEKLVEVNFWRCSCGVANAYRFCTYSSQSILRKKVVESFGLLPMMKPNFKLSFFLFGTMRALTSWKLI